MATIFKTEYGTWKAKIRRKGWPIITKSFRLKKDAEDWAIITESQIVRGDYVPRKKAEKMTVKEALAKYIKETSNKYNTEENESLNKCTERLNKHLGAYSLAALRGAMIDDYKSKLLSKGTEKHLIEQDLNLLEALYDFAIYQWEIGLKINPVFSKHITR